jgi:hypothetical protein
MYQTVQLMKYVKCNDVVSFIIHRHCSILKWSGLFHSGFRDAN